LFCICTLFNLFVIHYIHAACYYRHHLYLFFCLL
jgi:hypothetical protein